MNVPLSRIPDFHRERVIVGDDHNNKHEAYRARCSACGKTEDFVARWGWKSSQEALERHFREHGWRIGRARRKDLCPECHHPKHQPKEKPVQQAVQPAPASAVVSIDAARQPTLDQNRAIRDELDNAYDEKKRRYRGKGSDELVAKELNVPRNWVAVVRSAFYGPDINEAAEAFAEDVAKLRAELSKLEAQITQATDLYSQLAARCAELEKRRR
jgi:hypothetical protein